ncbi:hypothetical protein [Streptomyces sp. NPDC060366]|uniref:hypothetical protein n=1 Tax=Streptomyces sp. NPDC060366 TaxID=3347105 RepID=UPI003659CFFD
MNMNFPPEQTLAALDEATYPTAETGLLGEDYDRGRAWARGQARRLMYQTSMLGTPAENLAVTAKVLREWLAAGHDDEGSTLYIEGVKRGQRILSDILDGDYTEVVDAISDAALRTEDLYEQAKQV